MGWKKDAKKAAKDMFKKSSIFDYSDGESSIILWERANGSVDSWSMDGVISEINYLRDMIIDTLSIQNYPMGMRSFDWNFSELSFIERFDKYLTISDFDHTFEYLEERHGQYAAKVAILALTKFTWYTTEKFWKVFNSTFANKDVNEGPYGRIFEAMQRTGLEAIQKIIQTFMDIIGDMDLNSYKHHLTVEEIIDLGEEHTWHWSKMLDQIIDLTIETYIFETQYGQTTESSYSYSFADDEDFDDFFEKTKTMVFNDEANEAFNHFGLTKLSTPDEFKKVYRKMAKMYHPDINPEPSAAIEMKKINVYKNIIEEYFDKN